MDRALWRRSVLAVTGAAAVGAAGCLGAEAVPGLVVHNGMAESVSFTVEISREGDGVSVFSERGSLGPDESVAYEEPVPEAGGYTIEAAAGNRAERYEWHFTEDRSVGVRLVFRPDGWELSEYRE